MHLLILAAFAAPTHYLNAEFVAEVEKGRALDWHPNRIIQSISVDGDTATLELLPGAIRSCAYSEDGERFEARCEGETVRGEVADGALVLGPPLDGIRLVPSARSKRAIFAAEDEKLYRAELPKVRGEWRRGSTRITLGDTAPEGVRVFACTYESAKTACLQVDRQRYVLLDGEFRPAAVYNDDNHRDYFATRLETGESWVPDVSCSRAICGLTLTDGDESQRFVPRGDGYLRQLGPTENLLGRTLSIESSTSARIEVRVRAHTRGAVYVDDPAVGWGDLGAVTPWTPLAGSETFPIPGSIEPAPVSLSIDEIAARVQKALPPSRADELFRSRAVEAARTCKTADTRPCVTGIGALEIEVRALEGSEAVDTFTLTIERGFGC